jgi:multidrug efflux pump
VPGGFGASEEMHTGMVIVFLQDLGQARRQHHPGGGDAAHRELARCPAVRALPQVRSGLVRSGGQPLNVVLGGPDYAELAQWRDRMLARMEQNPGLFGADSDYKETRPQIRVRSTATAPPTSASRCRPSGARSKPCSARAASPPSSTDGEEYDVILQAARDERASVTDLANLYVRSRPHRRADAAGERWSR